MERMDDWMINSNVIYNILHFVVKPSPPSRENYNVT